MTPDLDRIRTTHAAAIANRQRGSFDSRDDDIGVLLAEVERLRASEVCHSATIEALKPDVELIVPAGYYLRRHAGPAGCALPLELCRERDGQLILSVFGLTRKSSVEVFNAAARALEETK